MNPLAMVPFGKSLRAYFEGDTAAELIIHRNDGRESPVPVGVFFRDPSAFSAIETAAIASCSGRVLDVGAGTGMHSLALTQEGLTVTAMDLNERIWIAESGVNPNRLVGFNPKTQTFFSITEIPSGGGAIRHMYFHAGSNEIWFGTGTNTIGRARIAP